MLMIPIADSTPTATSTGQLVAIASRCHNFLKTIGVIEIRRIVIIHCTNAYQVHAVLSQLNSEGGDCTADRPASEDKAVEIKVGDVRMHNPLGHPVCGLPMSQALPR